MLTEFSKGSILNLMRDVNFADENGQKHINILRASLYNTDVPSDDSLLYSITEDTEFDGTSDILHTGVNPFYID